jgi:hypothetical protein
LGLRQNPLRVEQQVQRFIALVEIIPALRCQRKLARRPLQQRDAQLGFERRNFPADRGNRHAKGVRRATEAFELRDLHENRDIVQIDHPSIIP